MIPTTAAYARTAGNAGLKRTVRDGHRRHSLTADAALLRTGQQVSHWLIASLRSRSSSAFRAGADAELSTTTCYDVVLTADQSGAHLQREPRYPTRTGRDGQVRYVGPDGYAYPTIERLERTLRVIEDHTASCAATACRYFHGSNLLR